MSLSVWGVLLGVLLLLWCGPSNAGEKAPLYMFTTSTDLLEIVGDTSGRLYAYTITPCSVASN